jgi:indole-3-glycerol phosphate synthase
MTILEQIVAVKHEEAACLKRRAPICEWKRMTACLPPARNFRSALAGRECRIIAEVKRRSPSRGLLSRDFDPARIASFYQENGAAAVSVLTDRDFFGGDKEYLIDIKGEIRLPLLRKDFIVDPCQIYEARLLGADAVLLIAGILEAQQLSDYLAVVEELGLAALVEVHDRQDLDKALASGAGIIGVNNRNLKTFVTDLRTSLDLVARIPEDRIVVSESGIRTRADIETLTAAGIHAFLVGETLMQAEDRGGKLRELMGK